jgi:hypothetical protein
MKTISTVDDGPSKPLRNYCECPFCGHKAVRRDWTAIAAQMARDKMAKDAAKSAPPAQG